jgi:hypothetical protein
MRFSLFPFRSPLLRESRLLSLPAGTEMFHFPALPPAVLCIQTAATPHDGGQVSPFGNPRITAWLPAPRGISQAPTSFIGSWYQGIHRVLLKTWHNKNYSYAENSRLRRERELQVIRCSRPLCSSQDTDSTTAAIPYPRKAAAACSQRKPGEARFLRTQQRAHSARRSKRPFRGSRKGDVLAAPSRAG